MAKASTKSAAKAAKGKSATKTRLPLPAGIPPAKKGKLPKPVRRAESRVLRPLAAEAITGEARILDDIWKVVGQRLASGDTATSHSARLIARGTAKVAQKLGEEAVECVIEAALGNREATILESADLLYHLMVVWVDAGIQPAEVWAELARRQGVSGIAEKASRTRGLIKSIGTSKLP